MSEEAGPENTNCKQSKWRKLAHFTNVWRHLKVAIRAARIRNLEKLISEGLPGEVTLIMFDEIVEPERPPPEYFKGVRQILRTSRWISEIRPTLGLFTSNRTKRIWLGSFGTATEAARAFDVGVYFWKEDQRVENFNFPDSPDFLRRLEPDRVTWEEQARVTRTKELAQLAAARGTAAREFGSMSSSRRRDARAQNLAGPASACSL